MCIIHQDENILLNRIQKKCYSAKSECGFLLSLILFTFFGDVSWHKITSDGMKTQHELLKKKQKTNVHLSSAKSTAFFGS